MTETGLPKSNPILEPILGIDPGNVQSAYVLYNPATRTITEYGLVPNSDMLKVLHNVQVTGGSWHMAIEMIASYGMSVGASVFETCVWIGRFIQQWTDAEFTHKYRYVYRKDEKIHLCGSMKAKDGNIRQAIMDRYGSTRQLAIGTKKTPGPLYGMHDDIWAAFAVAITAAETAEEWRKQ